MPTPPAPLPRALLAQVSQLIHAARQRVALAVNAERAQLYWHIGRRISAELLQGQRAEYGKQVVAELARQLTADFGKGWSEQQLRHCVRLAEVFADEEILSAVRRELTWSHLKPSCTSPLRLPARNCKAMSINKTCSEVPIKPAATRGRSYRRAGSTTRVMTEAGRRLQTALRAGHHAPDVGKDSTP